MDMNDVKATKIEDQTQLNSVNDDSFESQSMIILLQCISFGCQNSLNYEM